MARRSGRILAARSRERLAELGASPIAEHFVCPLCLRLLPDARASVGHYPARAVSGWHGTEVLCRDCNSFIGRAYESQAIDYLDGIHSMRFGPPGGGTITSRARIRQDPDAIGIEIVGTGSRRAGPSPLAQTLQELRARSASPHELEVTLGRPSQEQPKRGLLAWSYLAWFFYAGYRYVVSDGAYRVRELLLNPDVSLPVGSFFAYGGVTTPLPEPQPILIVRVETAPLVPQDIDEFIALGVEWGDAVSVLPFANDHDGQGWRRIAELFATDQLRTVGRWPLRKMLSIPLIEKGLDKDIVIERDGVRSVVAATPTTVELADLASGHSPKIMEPSSDASGRGYPPMTKTVFSVVANPSSGGPPLYWQWRGCALDLFDYNRLIARLSRTDVMRADAAFVPGPWKIRGR